MPETTFTEDDIAQLAGHFTGMYLEMLADMQPHGATWQDLIFANMIALKSLALVQCEGDQDIAGSQLGQIFEMARDAQVIGKKFKSEEEAAAWLAEQGRNPDGSPMGQVH